MWKSKLNERSQKERISNPVYTTNQTGTGFASVLTFNGQTYATAEVFNSKAAAEEAVAAHCCNLLQSAQLPFVWLPRVLYESSFMPMPVMLKTLYVSWKESRDAPELLPKFMAEIAEIQFGDKDPVFVLKVWLGRLAFRAGYIKDLTIYGIEPNPGPPLTLFALRHFARAFEANQGYNAWSMADFFTQFIARFPDNWDQALDSWAFVSDSTWVPDLTEQGIEPNPGPQKKDVKIVEEKIKTVAKPRPKPKPKDVALGETKFNAKRELQKTSQSVRKQLRLNAASPGKDGKPMNRAIARILRGFSLPISEDEGTVMTRISTLGQTMKGTVVADPRGQVDADWQTGTDGTKQLPDNQFAAFLFRDPFRAAVQYEANSANNDYSYQAQFLDVVADVLTSQLRINCPDNEITLDINIGCFNNLNAEGEFAPHGSVLYTGRATNSPKSFVWLDKDPESSKGGMITFTKVSGSFSSGATLEINAFIANEKGIGSIIFVGSISVGTGAATFAPTKSGYYAFTANWQQGTANTDFAVIECTITSNPSSVGGSVLGHHAIPQIEEMLNLMDQIRIGGCSIRYAERAAYVNNQGAIVGAQLNGSTPWFNLIGATFYDTVTEAQQMKSITIDKGMYGFLKPTDMNQLSFDHVEYSRSPTSQGKTYFQINTSDPYLVIAAKVATADGRDAFLEYGYGVEYMSTSCWFTYGKNSYHPSFYEDALWRLNNIQQWHENPVHFKDLWAAVTKAARDTAEGVLEYAPKFKKLLFDLRKQ